MYGQRILKSTSLFQKKNLLICPYVNIKYLEYLIEDFNININNRTRLESLINDELEILIIMINNKIKQLFEISYDESNENFE